MSKLKYELMNLTRRNRDGSFATQANRRDMLVLFVTQLKEVGYKVRELGAADLKGRHVNALVKRWIAEGLSAGTIKNRMAVLRWWAEKIGAPQIVKENSVYGIENREFVTNKSKAVTLKDLDLSQFDSFIAQSLKLQDAFGLRREEAIKFQASYALNGLSPNKAQEIRIKGSWAKGGRDRVIPITSDIQRQELMNTLRLVGTNALIPTEKSYKTHLALFMAQTAKAGIGRTHGLRHGYAQRRYFELTGFECPAVAGTRKLSPDERAKDLSARLTISQELGHNRINITAVYIGSWSR